VGAMPLEVNTETPSRNSFLARLRSTLSRGLKYAAYPLAGSVFVAATYLFFERNMLLKQNDTLKKSLDEERAHTQNLSSEHQKQVETYKLALEESERRLSYEKDHSNHLRTEYSLQIEIYKVITATKKGGSTKTQRQLDNLRTQQISN
jgi:hypothetical protein